MTLKSQIKKLAYWTFPAGVYNSFNNYRSKAQKTKEENADRLLKIIKPNSIFKDKHKGSKRCFILCNGPSINTQNLLVLKNEVVFSVSNGYHHSDYLCFQPAYHCIPQLTYSEMVTESYALDWFKEMDKSIGTATLFLSANEYNIVKRNNLFLDRSIYYNYFSLPWDNNRSLVYDISKKIPLVQSVPIMSLIIAMYMGFEKIYLLGTEHDSAITKEYKYFSEAIKMPYKYYNDKKDTSMYLEFESSFILWRQYRTLKKIALSNGITIYNATAGGILDEFERVKFEDLFKN